MSQFYITAVRHSSDPSFISHVLVHTNVSSTRLSKGVIKSKADIITEMGNKHTFKTAVYNYSSGSWTSGADVGTVEVSGKTYLRTDRDSTSRDNLGNLLHIDELR